MMQNYKNQQKSLVYCWGSLSHVFDDKIVLWRQKAWKRQKSWKSVLFAKKVWKRQKSWKRAKKLKKRQKIWKRQKSWKSDKKVEKVLKWNEVERKQLFQLFCRFFNFFVVFKLFWCFFNFFALFQLFCRFQTFLAKSTLFQLFCRFQAFLTSWHNFSSKTWESDPQQYNIPQPPARPPARPTHFFHKFNGEKTQPSERRG